MLQTILLAVHIVLATALIAIILLQQGRGATTGAAFGSGASSTVFGARGSASFLSRTTSVLAILFFGNCLLLGFLAARHTAPLSIVQQLQQHAPAVKTPAPATDVPPVSTAPVSAPPSPSDMPSIPAGKP